MHVFNFAALFTVLATFTATAAGQSYTSNQRYHWRPADKPIREDEQENAGHRRGGAEYFTSGSPSIVAEDYSARNNPTRYEQWKAQQKERNERKQDRGLNGIRRVDNYYP